MKKTLSILFLIALPVFAFSQELQDPGNPFYRGGVDAKSAESLSPKDKFCADFNSFASSLKAYNILNEKTAESQYKAAQNNIDVSWNKLQGSAANMPEINMTEIEAAYLDLKKMVGELTAESDMMVEATKIDQAAELTNQKIDVIKAASCL